MLVRPRTLLALLTLVTLGCGDGGGGETGSGDGTGTSGEPTTTGDDDTTAAATDGETGSESTGEPVDPEVFPGLDDEVEIAIDERGIPHIYGATDRDVFYASGYQMATDRLFQMDLMRRRAYGRGAEVLGPGKIDEDKISRLFDFPRWGVLNADRLRSESPEGYGLFVAWVAGVNARVDEVLAGEAPLPTGFGPDEADYMPERWANVDPFVIAKMLAFANSNTLEYEFLASVVARTSPETYAAIELLKPGMPVFSVPPEDRPDAGQVAPVGPDAKAKLQQAAQALPPDAAAQLRRMHDALAGFHVLGSNNWAVDGRFTENDRPLIANDPHQPLQSPNVMYALHMNSADGGGQIDAAGFGFAGAPGVQLGHNRHISWAATTGFADCMDLYSVSTTGTTVNVGGESAPITVRSEAIKVKGEPDTILDVQDVEGYGVLLGDALPFPEGLAVDDGRHVMINWTGFRATNEAASFMAMGRATSIAEWEAAVDLMEVGTFNWLAADKDGISYHLHALIPDRGDPKARPMPFTVVDGDVAAYYWTDQWLPASKLPQSRAEQTGFIVTANNDPWGFTADGDVGNDPWYYGAFYDPGYRAARIEKRLKELTEAGDVSITDMQALQTDTHSGLADQLLPVLAMIYATVESDDALEAYRDRPELDTLITLLTIDWNRSMDMAEPGALAFHAFQHFLAEEVYSDDLPLTFVPILEASAVVALKFTSLAVLGEYPNADELLQQGRGLLVMRALASTADWLEAEFGTVNPGMYTWGERHGTRFANAFGGPLDGGWVPTNGGEDTVNVSGSVFFAVDIPEVVPQFESHDGPVFRSVTQFSEDGTPETYVNFPRGNSGDPSSPHWEDTLQDWRDGAYKKYPYSRAEVDAVTEQTIVLEP